MGLSETTEQGEIMTRLEMDGLIRVVLTSSRWTADNWDDLILAIINLLVYKVKGV